MKKFFLRKSDMSDNTKIVLSALLVALFVVLRRPLAIPTPLFNFDLVFIPIIFAAFVMGPVWAMLVAGLGDLVAAVAFPVGIYSPLITLSFMIAGFVYGLFLFRKRNKSNKTLLINLIIASLIVLVGERILLMSLWLQILFGDAWLVILGTRAVAFAIVLPIQIAIMWVVCRFLREPIERFLVIDTEQEDDLKNDQTN